MTMANLDAAITYIENHPEIRDVLISGGDPLILSDEKIEALLTKLRAIKHVEIIRIGTKVPVNLPMRITKKLIQILKKHNLNLTVRAEALPIEIFAEIANNLK